MDEQAPLQQPKPSTLYGLDHLRALAIILVFVYHYGRLFPHPEWTNRISVFGWTGVDLFFVLSGYLIASQLFASVERTGTISLTEFFIKRFFRILPAYFVVVTLYFLFPPLREHEVLAPLWKYLTFTQNLGLDLRTQGTFSHAWSLCVEEQFYLLFPLLLLLLIYCKLLRKGSWVLGFLFPSGLTIRAYSWHALVAPHQGENDVWVYWHQWIYYITYCRLDGLLFGVSIAAVFQYRPAAKKWIQQRGYLFLLAGLLVLTAGYFLCLNEQSFNASVFGFPVVDLGYALLVLGAISPVTFLYKINSCTSTKIAALSFAVYLTHKIIIHQTQEQFAKLGIAQDNNLMFLICIVTCSLGAFLMNEVIELPFLKWRSKLLARMKTKPVFISAV